MSPQTLESLTVGAGRFVLGSGAIVELAPEIERLGGKAFLLGGPSSVDRISPHLPPNSQTASIRHVGQCSRQWAERYERRAVESGATVILGVGGGKCLDLAKAVATIANLPVITVPTSIATCAASSAVCIMYRDDGKPDGALTMSRQVDVVIADSDIIGTAPTRLTNAGILDSLAKLPELRHNSWQPDQQILNTKKAVATAIASEIFKFLTTPAEGGLEQGAAFAPFDDVILNNLLVTSVVSGFSAGTGQLALAHGFYDFMRREFTEDAQAFLHGEIVGVGLLLQLAFNGSDPAPVRGLMTRLHVPLTLEDVGYRRTPQNIQLLVDYFMQYTRLAPADIPRLKAALGDGGSAPDRSRSR